MKAAFGTLSLFTCLMLAIQCSNPASSDEKRTQVIVDQDITEDTVWESGKDYVVRGEVIVREGATLNIEPDVKVIFNKDGTDMSYLNIFGIIETNIGDNDKVTIFEAEEGTFNNNQVAIKIQNNKNSSSMQNCIFRNLPTAIFVTQTNIQIVNSNFENCYIGMRLSKLINSIIDFNKFEKGSFGIVIELSGIQGDSLVIKNNSFKNMYKNALDIQSSYLIIENNLFENMETGFFAHQDCHAHLVRNTITKCNKGIDTDGYFRRCILNYNVIKENTYGMSITGNSDFIINHNNFFNNIISHIEGHGENRTNSILIDASMNWWGTTSLGEIREKLYDNEDDADNNAFISIMPIENAEVEDCGSNIE